jgi:ParB family transcriptional regulator, chromosome partitioning protein
MNAAGNRAGDAVNDFSGEPMAEEPTRSRLGRGLASLIGDMGAETNAPPERPRAGQRRVAIEVLHPNPRNPRRHFAVAELDELAASIKERGVIQPIAVRPAPGANGTFEIIAGERRWRAAQRAGIHDVPVVVLEVSDAEALELAIIENVQREDLNALEEAAGYSALGDEFKYSQDDIAKVVGKSRSHVTNMLRLLKLPESVQALVRRGELSAGHARALIGHANAEALACDIVARGLNVRQVEMLVREQPASRAPRKPVAKDADTAALEKRLTDALGLKVTIDHKGEHGSVHIAYRDLDQLDEIVKRLERRGQ